MVYSINLLLVLKTKKGKTSKFLDAGGYNRNERERGGERETDSANMSDS